MKRPIMAPEGLRERPLPGRENGKEQTVSAGAKLVCGAAGEGEGGRTQDGSGKKSHANGPRNQTWEVGAAQCRLKG